MPESSPQESAALRIPHVSRRHDARHSTLGGGEGGGGGGGAGGGGGVAGGGDGVRSHLSHAAHWPLAHAHLVTHGLACVTHQPSQRALLSSTTVSQTSQPLHSSEPHLHLVDQEAAWPSHQFCGDGEGWLGE